jgi:hypothetical protein
MDTPEEITRLIAIITQRDAHKFELTLLFNEEIFETVIFKCL